MAAATAMVKSEMVPMDQVRFKVAKAAEKATEEAGRQVSKYKKQLDAIASTEQMAVVVRLAGGMIGGAITQMMDTIKPMLPSFLADMPDAAVAAIIAGILWGLGYYQKSDLLQYLGQGMLAQALGALVVDLAF
jgi:hypothetical protein